MLAELPKWSRTGGPGTVLWASEMDPPEIGTRVRITLNGWNLLGKGDEAGNILGTVAGYRDAAGWLMVWVRPDILPLWYQENWPFGRNPCLFAGIELELAREGE